MVARGEIGFLIASSAEERGVFAPTTATVGTEDTNNGPFQIYLVVIWAIVVCTVVGPLVVGILVRRINRQPTEEEET